MDKRYLYQGWHLLQEANGTTPLRQFYWGLDLSGTAQGAGGVGGLLLVEDNGKSFLPVYDAMGNLSGLMTTAAVTLQGSNYAAGDLVAAYAYDAYGRVLRASGAYAEANPFGYSTKYTHREWGLVYYGHRHYSPSMGRFIHRDPIEQQGGINLYAFVNNNPGNRWDYLGLKSANIKEEQAHYPEDEVDPIVLDTYIVHEDRLGEGDLEDELTQILMQIAYQEANAGHGSGASGAGGGFIRMGTTSMGGKSYTVWLADRDGDGPDVVPDTDRPEQDQDSDKPEEPELEIKLRIHVLYGNKAPNRATTQTESDRFLGFIRQQNVERKATDPVKVERIANDFSEIPESVREMVPDNAWGKLIYNKGNHLENLRLPGGYHLTVDRENGPVNLHYDAYDPLTGPWQTFQHWFHEVRNLNNGTLKELKPDDAQPDWGPN